MKYWRDHASYPYQSHELWFLTENVRWGKFTGKEDFKSLIAKVNREDLWREAAKELGVPAAQIPQSKSRGVEKFFDGKSFDPDESDAPISRALRSSACALYSSAALRSMSQHRTRGDRMSSSAQP